jgi:hypothetical protein
MACVRCEGGATGRRAVRGWGRPRERKAKTTSTPSLHFLSSQLATARAELAAADGRKDELEAYWQVRRGGEEL